MRHLHWPAGQEPRGGVVGDGQERTIVVVVGMGELDEAVPYDQGYAGVLSGLRLPIVQPTAVAGIIAFLPGVPRHSARNAHIQLAATP
jgi:hypothetical protein